jgi:hypothetical protein
MILFLYCERSEATYVIVTRPGANTIGICGMGHGQDYNNVIIGMRFAVGTAPVVAAMEDFVTGPKEGFE